MSSDWIANSTLLLCALVDFRIKKTNNHTELVTNKRPHPKFWWYINTIVQTSDSG